MTLRDRAGEPRLTLARGVSLFASASGLIATFADRARCTRVDLGDRAREREVIELLRRRQLDEVAKLGAERALIDAGVLRAASAVVASWIFDPRLEALLEALSREHRESVFVGLTTRGFWIVDHGAMGPCARCAVFFSRDYAVRASVLSELQSDSPLAPVGTFEALPEVVARWERRPPDRRRGRALVWRASNGRTHIERFGRHPSCSCNAASTPARRPLTWRAATSRELTPVVAVSAPRAPVERAVYRGTRKLVPSGAADFGVALASGPRARTRALAEAIERTCMLHARPDISNTPANALTEPRLPDEAIESLLFRPEEYAQAEFPFPRYDASLPLDWSWATTLGRSSSGRKRILVPTAIVGRVPPGGVRLVHATTNGYAADLDRERAIRSAILEVVERDAILLAWYLGRRLPRIELTEVMERAEGHRRRAWLATQDIDVPVVLMMAESDGVRAAAAAGTCFEEAFERAARELDALTRASASTRMGGAPRRGGPEHHQRAFAREGTRAFDDLDLAPISPRVLAERWPRSGALDLAAKLSEQNLEAYIVDRSLPELFGDWHVVRCLVPESVDLSWNLEFRRLASRRIREALARGETLSDVLHPIA